MLKFQKTGRADKLFCLRIPFPVELLGTNNSGQLLAIQRTDTFNQRLVRLNPDGTEDHSFAPVSFNMQLFRPEAVAAEADGKILVGGYVSDGSFLRRFGVSGEPDSSFAITGATFNSFADATLIRVQSNGQIIVAGNYVGTIQGVLRNHIARLNADGSLDRSYDPGLTLFAPNGELTFYYAALDSEENIYDRQLYCFARGTTTRDIATASVGQA